MESPEDLLEKFNKKFGEHAQIDYEKAYFTLCEAIAALTVVLNSAKTVTAEAESALGFLVPLSRIAEGLYIEEKIDPKQS